MYSELFHLQCVNTVCYYKSRKSIYLSKDTKPIFSNLTDFQYHCNDSNNCNDVKVGNIKYVRLLGNDSKEQ